MTIYYYDIRHSRLYLNSEEKNPELAIWADSSIGFKDMLSTILRSKQFVANDRKLHNTKDELELLFLEYIPRVFGQNTEVKKVKSIEDLPDYNWEEHIDKDLYKKNK